MNFVCITTLFVSSVTFTYRYMLGRGGRKEFLRKQFWINGLLTLSTQPGKSLRMAWEVFALTSLPATPCYFFSLKASVHYITQDGQNLVI